MKAMWFLADPQELDLHEVAEYCEEACLLYCNGKHTALLLKEKFLERFKKVDEVQIARNTLSSAWGYTLDSKFVQLSATAVNLNKVKYPYGSDRIIPCHNYNLETLNRELEFGRHYVREFRFEVEEL